MRDEQSFISDLFNLSSFEWNRTLAEEFNFDLGALVTAINEYNYSNPSEKTIHSSGRVSKEDLINNKEISSFKKFNEGAEVNLVSDPVQIYSLIATLRRDVANVGADYGKAFRGFLFFGVEFSSFDLAGVILDGCVFSNCTFNECFFPSALVVSSKFIECQFDKCDFANSNWSKTGLFGINLIGCNLEDSNFHDCVQHIVSYNQCELDGSTILSGSLHRVDINGCSMKKSNILNVIFSAVTWLNSNFRNGQLMNCRLIGCGFDMIHTDQAIQYANSYVGCNISSDLELFFSEENDLGGYDDDPEENSKDDGLSDKSFDEIMGTDDDDDD